jgi:hypothetical protein
MKPTFIGIGAPKAGTTWLFRCLQEHPQVYMTPMKETDYFAAWSGEPWSFDEKSAEEYERYFEGAYEQEAIGEISVRYLADRGAAERIHKVYPDIKLIVSLRNPIDQVYSHFWHLNRQNFHRWNASPKDGQMSFEDAIQKYRDRLIEPAFYFKHLQNWLSLFERSQIHIILYDDIVDRPSRVLKDLYAFLGVDTAFLAGDASNNAGSQVRQGTSPRSPFIHQVYLRLYAFLSSKLYFPLKRAVGVDRAERVKETLHIRQVMEAVFRRKGYPKMKAKTRRKIARIFANDVQRLGDLVERDLSIWLRN